jgi:acyl carrier protein
VNTEQTIIDIISDQFSFPTDEITLSASLVDDLGADSLDCVELIMALEEKFDIEISDHDAEKMITVQDVVDCVEGLI